MTATSNDITRLLREWRSGNDEALHQLAPLILKELRRTAKAYLARERNAVSWQPTLLVNEAFLRLVHCQKVDWQDRNHFFRLAAKKMREILVDYARKKRLDKQGGGALQMVPIDRAPEVHGKTENPVDLILLNTALDELETVDPRKTQIVEMKFFAGMTVEEIATSLNIAVSTVNRDLQLAKVWLFKAMYGDKGYDS